MFAVGNARATGAGVVITPLASARDGLLDVCVVGPVGRSSLAPLFLEVKRGEHLERDGVHYVQTSWLRVEAEEPIPVNVDGEPLPCGHFIAEEAAAALLERVMPFLSDQSPITT